MKKQRAQELLGIRSQFGNVASVFVTDLRNHMTEQEVNYVLAAWDTMPGNTSFRDALRKIAASDCNCWIPLEFISCPVHAGTE